jgi:hypothetical protein
VPHSKEVAMEASNIGFHGTLSAVHHRPSVIAEPPASFTALDTIRRIAAWIVDQWLRAMGRQAITVLASASLALILALAVWCARALGIF